MKRLLLIVAGCLLGLSLSAQSGRYVYWFDDDYDAHITDSLSATSQLQIGASHLAVGFHTLYMLIGSDSALRMESSTFFITPPLLPPDTFDQHYTYWLDQDMTQTFEGTLTGGQMFINCNSLDYGFHSLHILLGSGTTTRLENHIFYKTPPTRPADTFDQHYTYWFDQDMAQTYEGTLSGGQMLINCDSLSEGFHILNMRLGSGTTARLERHTFFIPPKALAENYTDLAYWYEGEGVMHHVSPLGGMHLLDVPQMDCGAQGKIFLMASDSLGNTSPVMAHEFVMMDSNCCLAPLFATADHVTDSGARLHWDYNRPQTYTLVYDTVPINDPNVGHNRVTLTDTLYWFTNMPSGIICYYAIKSDCGDRWTMGEWNTRCRALTPLYAEACDSYTWKGITYTASATVPEFVFTSTGGCDSVTVMHMTINHSSNSIETASACDSYTWHGTTYTSSTSSPSYTSTNSVGCDSTVTLHLTINHSTTAIENITACDSYTWHGTTYTSSTSSPSYTSTNAAGCDSTVTLHLTIGTSNSCTETVTACDYYTWHGTTYTSSTSTASYTSLNAAGCDSTTTLHLTINLSTTATETVTACDSYTWHGTTYTSSTSTASYTSLNAAGCDSTTTLHLTINYSTAAIEEVTACDSYTWHDTTYTSSTSTPSHTSTNAAGCDSTTTLHLTINYSTAAIEEVTACDSYTWHDSVYTTSAIDSITLTNAAGCDSTVTLHLTINYSIYDTIHERAVNSYEWNGQVLTETGEYVYEGQTEAGCDSIVTLKLTIDHVGIADVLDSEDMNIYPVPTTGQLTIEADGVTKVEVFDYAGRLAATFVNTNQLDISQLPSGTYALRITLQKGSTVRRVVKH